MFSAQRHNGTYFGENPADGYLLPWNDRNHPIELTWHHKEPVRRRPIHAAGSAGYETTPDADAKNVGNPTRVDAPAGGATINVAGFLEERHSPNRVQYMTGSQWMNLPAFDYVAFAGPSSNFAGIEKLLPFLQVCYPTIGGYNCI